MVQIGSVGGAALAFVLADRIGRLWATRQLCVLWILGIVIFLTNNGRLGQVYAGRFVSPTSIYIAPAGGTLLIATDRWPWNWTDYCRRPCLHF